MIAHAGLAPDELVIDLFAGGGGASTGIEGATGRPVDVAINHDEHAIAVHAVNHRATTHLCESVFDVDPVDVCRGRPVGLMWASPDCTHHSRARGGKPREKKIRALAWVVVRWAAAVAPRIICLENVEEFEGWGPLDDDGQPIKERAGETFKDFVGQLRGLGYAVEWRSLVAADYGAPTTRTRLFMVARRDGRRIVWPEPTHGEGRALPYRTAAECIDWSLPCASIFLAPADAKAWAKVHGGRPPQRPLAEATQRRIAEGIRRYVLGDSRPFVVQVTHGARLHDAGEPLPTVTATRREMAVVAPTLLRTDHQSDERLRGVASVTGPIRTMSTSGGIAIAAATLINTRNGERDGQAPRTRDIERPFGTVTAEGSQGALVAAFLAKHYGGVVGQPVDRPVGTVTAVDHHSLVAACLARYQGERRLDEPGRVHDVDAPLGTITTANRFGLVAAFLCKYYGSQVGQHQAVDDPLHTIVAKARFGLVTVTIDGEEYAIVDIGMRMLQPRELAAAQGFPADYVLLGTKEQQTARIGNSVCPPVARALVAAQLDAPEIRRKRKPVQMPMFRGDQEAA